MNFKKVMKSYRNLNTFYDKKRSKYCSRRMTKI